MSSFGEKLRHERERHNATLEEIADATEIQLRYLEALETNDFAALPGEAFGKLYIRAYAEVVGFDPKPLIADYDQELWSHRREQSRKRGEVRSSGVSPEEPARTSDPDPADADRSGDPVATEPVSAPPVESETRQPGPETPADVDPETSIRGEAEATIATEPEVPVEPAGQQDFRSETEASHLAPPEGPAVADLPEPKRAPEAVSREIEPAESVDATGEKAVPLDRSTWHRFGEDELRVDIPPPEVEPGAGRFGPLVTLLVVAGLVGIVWAYLAVSGDGATDGDPGAPTGSAELRSTLPGRLAGEVPPDTAPARGSEPSPTGQPGPDRATEAPGAATAEEAAGAETDAPTPVTERGGGRVARAPVEGTDPAGAGGPVPGRLSVSQSGVGLRVVNRRLEGRGDRFEEGTVVWYSTRVLGGTRGEKIRHVWRREGKAVQSIELALGGSHWRTHSSKTLWGTGRWAVEARDPSGRVLARTKFSCVPRGS